MARWAAEVLHEVSSVPSSWQSPCSRVFKLRISNVHVHTQLINMLLCHWIVDSGRGSLDHGRAVSKPQYSVVVRASSQHTFLACDGMLLQFRLGSQETQKHTS